MALLSPYKYLMLPLGERIQSDPRFEGINVFIDRSEKKVPSTESIPCINYFWIPPAYDMGRGSQASGLNYRRFQIDIGLGIWVIGNDPGQIDEALWQLYADLTDFLTSPGMRDFDANNGITLRDLVPIKVEGDYTRKETDPMASILVGANYEFFVT